MKLDKFKFNNVMFKSRIFESLDAHFDLLMPENVLPSWLELFSGDVLESDEICQQRLFELVGFGCKTMMTTRHYVDPFGEAWPQETFIVLEDDRPNCRFALVTVIPQ